MTHLEAKCNDDVIDGSLRRGYDFNLYSKSMICGVNRTLVEDTRRVVLGRT